MASSGKISALFDDITNNMLQSFQGWDKYIPPGGEEGGVRERRVRDFLTKHLVVGVLRHGARIATCNVV